jgi:NADP-dependent 3-hydroxy acid dehydrogenase YdfG
MPSTNHSSKVAVVTGAGSGVGRATVHQLAAEGWQVALLGRRADALEETIQSAPEAGRKNLTAFPCDVGNPSAFDTTAAAILKKYGRVDALVNGAGINIPKRALSVLSRDDYKAVMAANIDGTLFAVQAFLPGMRNAGGGTIVNICSDAGIKASAKSGAGYAISKFGMRALTQSINEEERQNGIRGVCICPGDINTPILDKRPVPPPAESRPLMLQAEDVAAAVLFAVNLHPRALVEELVIRPTRTYVPSAK